MVGHHVAQAAGRLVEGPALLDADGFRRRDLDVVDVLAPPRRLEHAVGETHGHDALDRLLAQEMVDAVELAFVALLEDARVERLGRGEVAAEGFFDDHAPELCRRPA